MRSDERKPIGSEMGTNEFVPASLALLGFIEAILDHVDDFGEFLREVLAELRIVIFLNVSEFLQY